MSDKRQQLIEIVREKSFSTGEFTLASGKTSKYYIDCRLTTLDARGACLLGEILLAQINAEAETRAVKIDAVGGMTMGADPISVAVSMSSHLTGQQPVLQAFVVRKEPKGHGQGKQVEGNFKAGDTVVAIEDVITTGGSTLRAIEAIEREGGKVAFVAVLVDRQEGGREIIEAAGYPVISVFTRDELMG
ncbi:MAG: orotate phosphoribosyltransferase [Verrucomicrobiales bacterium]|jgi:orotate phosphoribosyltransferase